MCLLKVLSKCQCGSLWLQPAVITEYHHSLAVPSPAAAKRAFFCGRKSTYMGAALKLFPTESEGGLWSWPTITLFFTLFFALISLSGLFRGGATYGKKLSDDINMSNMSCNIIAYFVYPHLRKGIQHHAEFSTELYFFNTL